MKHNNGSFSRSICKNCKKERGMHRGIDGRCPVKINIYSRIRDTIWHHDEKMIWADSGLIKPTKEEHKLGLSQEQIKLNILKYRDMNRKKRRKVNKSKLLPIKAKPIFTQLLDIKIEYIKVLNPININNFMKSSY